MIQQGIYEQLIYVALQTQLEQATEKMFAQTETLDHAEAPKIIAKYLAEIIEKSLRDVLTKLSDDEDGVQKQIELANKIVNLMQVETGMMDVLGMSVSDQAKMLTAVIKRMDTSFAVNQNRPVIKPESSIAMSSLFTGAVHEPSLYTEFNKEIVSCDRIDMLVSFIKWSGLRLIYDALLDFTQNGGRLRIITTSYMGATDLKAIEMLHQLNNTEIKVSYDTKRTRLHAKTYLFYRNTGFTTCLLPIDRKY